MIPYGTAMMCTQVHHVCVYVFKHAQSSPRALCMCVCVFAQTERCVYMPASPASVPLQWWLAPGHPSSLGSLLGDARQLLLGPSTAATLGGTWRRLPFQLQPGIFSHATSVGMRLAPFTAALGASKSPRLEVLWWPRRSLLSGTWEPPS